MGQFCKLQTAFRPFTQNISLIFTNMTLTYCKVITILYTYIDTIYPISFKHVHFIQAPTRTSLVTSTISTYVIMENKVKSQHVKQISLLRGDFIFPISISTAGVHVLCYKLWHTHINNTLYDIFDWPIYWTFDCKRHT